MDSDVMGEFLVLRVRAAELTAERDALKQRVDDLLVSVTEARDRLYGTLGKTKRDGSKIGIAFDVLSAALRKEGER